MHSLKQTFVAVVLLGVSFGLYHISLIPSEMPDGNPHSENLLAEDAPLRSSSLLIPETSFLPTNTLQNEPGVPSLASVPVAGSPSIERPGSFDVPALSSPTSNSVPAPPAFASQGSVHTSPPAQGSNVSADDGSQFVQREAVAESRDQGLIEALKNQSPAESSSGTFAAPPDRYASTRPDVSQFESFASPPARSEDSAPLTGGGFHANVDAQTPIGGTESLTIRSVWEIVDRSVESEDFYTALKLLSGFYKDPTLTGPQRQRLMGWLDALAAKVIFSSEDHLVSQPYVAHADESLAEISKNWQVPPQLIANIHRDDVSNLDTIPAGTRLKQVPGPFHAELNLEARVITLFLGDLYAGRFPVVIGTSGEPKPGTFEVVLKSESGYTWRDSTGKEFPPDAEENGYGPHWIGLSGALCIHAIRQGTEDGHAGCIGLSQQDAMDLFSILSEQSKFTIVP